MNGEVLDIKGMLGAPVARHLMNQARHKVAMSGAVGKPGLAIIQVGDHKPSNIYVEAKRKACLEVGFDCTVYRFGDTDSHADIVRLISDLNKDSSVNGIMVQLPLPNHQDDHAIINAILPDKDVDCLTSANLGLLVQGRWWVLPATVKAIITMLDFYEVEIPGAKIGIVGRSKLVGMPLACVLMSPGIIGDATVRVMHEHTQDIDAALLDCDIIVSAVGKEGFSIRGHQIASGAVLLDVAIRSDDDGKITGDLHESVWDKADLVSPVPGGVGPVTVAALVFNLATAFLRQLKT